jgi:uncharacterized protein YbjT (DUF2867 family)
MIVVTAGTGTIGAAMANQLHTSGIPFKLVSRDRLAAQKKLGDHIPCATGSLDQVASLKAAFMGARSVFMNVPLSPKMLDWQNNIITAAKSAGIEQIIKLSGSDMTIDSSSGSLAGKMHAQAEQALAESGLSYTILRPTYFMQNMLGPMAQSIRKKDSFSSPLSGDIPISMVDARDVAEVTYICFVHRNHDNAVYSLAGEPVTMNDAVHYISYFSGREVRYRRTNPVSDLFKGKAKGVSAWKAKHDRLMMKLLNKGYGVLDSDIIGRLTGYQPRNLELFAYDHIQHFMPEN